LFISERGHALVTQELSIFPQLTVEDYFKWYDLQLLLPNGKVHSIKPWDVTDDCDWFDHYISPKGFDLVARTLRVSYDEATMNKVKQLFSTNYLDAADTPDVEIPKDYLPSENPFGPDKEYMVLRSVRDEHMHRIFEKSLGLSGHIHDFITHMSAFYLNDELLERYHQDFQGAYGLAKQTGLPQVVEGEGPGFFVIYANGGASWCTAYAHYDFMTEGELEIHQAKEKFITKEISIDEFKRIKSENEGK